MSSTQIQNYLQGAYNVRDWGALGNGNQDAAPIIQNALNQLLGLTGNNGGTLILPSGEYYLSSTVTLVDSCTLHLMRGATILLRAGASCDMFTATGQQPFYINGDGVIDGNGSAQSSGHILNFINCNRVKIAGVKLSNAKQDGIRLDGCGQCSIADTVETLGNGRHGIAIVDGANHIINGVSATNAGDGCNLSGTAQNCAFGSFVATTNTGYGIREAAASACDWNLLGAAAVQGNTAGATSLVGAHSGYV